MNYRCLGCFLVIGVVCSGVLSSELISLNDPPFFLIWLSTNWLILSILYPLFCRERISYEVRKEGLSLRKLFLMATPLYLLWMTAASLFLYSFHFISPPTVTTLSSSALLIIFSLSFPLLKDRFTFAKLTALLFVIVGLALTVFQTWDFSHSSLGIALAVVASVCVAGYQLIFKLGF